MKKTFLIFIVLYFFPSTALPWFSVMRNAVLPQEIARPPATAALPRILRKYVRRDNLFLEASKGPLDSRVEINIAGVKRILAAN